jgi:hypothetical protein
MWQGWGGAWGERVSPYAAVLRRSCIPQAHQTGRKHTGVPGRACSCLSCPYIPTRGFRRAGRASGWPAGRPVAALLATRRRARLRTGVSVQVVSAGVTRYHQAQPDPKSLPRSMREFSARNAFPPLLANQPERRQRARQSRAAQWWRLHP